LRPAFEARAAPTRTRDLATRPTLTTRRPAATFTVGVAADLRRALAEREAGAAAPRLTRELRAVTRLVVAVLPALLRRVRDLLLVIAFSCCYSPRCEAPSQQLARLSYELSVCLAVAWRDFVAWDSAYI